MRIEMGVDVYHTMSRVHMYRIGIYEFESIN